MTAINHMFSDTITPERIAIVNGTTVDQVIQDINAAGLTATTILTSYEIEAAYAAGYTM